jgi:SAM-dependent methyltransferase
MSRWRAPAALVQTASARYRPAGRFALHFARGKLGMDPAFTALLALGVLSGRERILDLGCGQGLLAAWLWAARQHHAAGWWPAQWPEVPRPQSIRGIERMARDVRRARDAVGMLGEFTVGDIREAPFGTADAAVILDVLHYIDYPAQVEILRRVHAALVPGGVLLTRVGDAQGGLPFRFSTWVDRAVLLFRGHGLAPLYCRPVAAWLTLLHEIGFETEAVPMSAGTPFANVMLIAHRH